MVFLNNSFLIDEDLLNFSTTVDFTTTTTTPSPDYHQPLLPPPLNPFHHHHLNNHSSSTTSFHDSPTLSSADPTADLCIPYDDVAELEWLSQFVDNCFHDDFPAAIGEAVAVGSSVPQYDDTTFTNKADHNSTRSRAAGGKSRPKTEPNGGSTRSPSAVGERSGSDVRRCTHCAAEKTPQWRSGPLGPKTLCNACGVRFKSGRLVPEYRPASSPTFVLSQHSNSHRKVLELRRQKELMMVKLEGRRE